MSKVTPVRRRELRKTVQKPAPVASKGRRASQRERERGIEMQLGYPGKLRPMMIEQSRTQTGGYITVYAGARGEFLAAGVPSHLIPDAGSREFEICRPRQDQLRATMSATGIDQWELEIDWGDEMPRDNGHPAICELARMMLIDLGYWYSEHCLLGQEDLEKPIRELIADDRAEDFKPKASSPRLQISSDFRKRLSEISHQLFMQVHRYGEVFPVQGGAVKKTDPHGSPMRLVVNNTKGSGAAV